jgi:alkylation response protein AidB-like acyl-CoA dehydrogenase
LVLRRAEALCELVSEESATSERLGRLTEKVVDALLEAGLFSILLPESACGLGGTRLDFFESAETLSRADGSAGWCVSLSNTANLSAFRGLDAAGRTEVFTHGLVCARNSLRPNATTSAVPGGFRVSGKWAWGTGSSFAQWVIFASVAKDAEGGNLYRAYLVPREQVELIDGTWDTLGLRATHSVDYAIADKFVPTQRTYEYKSEGLAPTRPLPAMEIIRLNQIGLTGFASGVGQRVLSEFIAASPKTKRDSAEGFQSENHIVQSGVAELGGRLRAAASHYRELLGHQDAVIGRGDPVGRALRSELSLAMQTVARAARDTAAFAFEHAGSSVVYASNPIQRSVRDLLTGLKHAAFSPSIFERIGQVTLGLPPLPMPF